MRYFAAIICLLSFCLAGLAHGQSNTEMLKKSFLRTIRQDFKSYQNSAEEDKAQPEKTITYNKSNNTWYAVYHECYDFTYDIKRTDSIVLPYLGVVTFRCKSFGKKGTSKAECLNDKWTSDYDSTLTLKYAYQEGGWVLNDIQPLFKKH